MVKRSGSLQSILREFALPIHYKKTQRQLEMMQEQANKYLADNPLAKEILHIIK
jgi:isocitrate dehydrogenase kinase/phosphatase